MVWSNKTQPTRANIKKRLHAALEALVAADDLIAHTNERAALTASRNAQAWVRDGIRKLDQRSGKRTCRKAA